MNTVMANVKYLSNNTISIYIIKKWRSVQTYLHENGREDIINCRKDHISGYIKQIFCRKSNYKICDIIIIVGTDLSMRIIIIENNLNIYNVTRSVWEIFDIS